MKTEIDKMKELLYQEPSEEQLQKDLEEIQKKRLIYQKEVAEARLACYKEETDHKRKRYRSVVKAALVVLVSGTCLFAFSMRSEATRMWWLEKVERLIGSERGFVVNNDENRVISEFIEEDAITDIKEKTGIPMPKILYVPEGLVYEGYEYDEVFHEGALYYLYGGNIVTVNGYAADNNASFSMLCEGNVLAEEVVKTGYADVQVWEIQGKEDNQSSVVAEWIYQNHLYQLEGKLPFEEALKIIENILY